MNTTTNWAIFAFVILVSTGLMLSTYDIIEQSRNNDAKEAIQKMSYYKDQNSNCYAYQPNTPKFSWIPCELTK